MLSRISQAFSGVEHQSFTWPGGKNAVLMLHGFAGTPAEMHPLAMLFHEAGWTVHAPLLPGFGKDIETLPEHTHDEWIAVGHQQLKRLKGDYDQVLLVGNSMGSALSLAIAAENPANGLILFAPFWKFDHILWSMLPGLKHLFPNIKPFKLNPVNFSDADTRSGILNFIPDLNLDDVEIQQHIQDFSVPVSVIDQLRIVGGLGYQAAPYVECPTLIIQGLQDDIVQAGLTRKLIQKIRGPIQYLEIEGTHELIDPSLRNWRFIEQVITHFSHQLCCKGIAR